MKGCNDYTEEATGWLKNRKESKRSLKLIVVLVVLVAAVAALVVFWPRIDERAFSLVNDQQSAEKISESEPKTNSAIEDVRDTEATKAPEKEINIIIYLTGAVGKPGVYELPEKARINDAIIVAQGLSDEAAVDYINLAAGLQDGEHIHIPSIAEIESGEARRIKTGIGASTSSGLEPNNDQSSSEEQRININTADSGQLQSLPGIGEITAKRIIDYREKNGPFKNIEDLRNISGIGEKKYADLVDKVCI